MEKGGKKANKQQQTKKQCSQTERVSHRTPRQFPDSADRSQLPSSNRTSHAHLQFNGCVIAKIKDLHLTVNVCSSFQESFRLHLELVHLAGEETDQTKGAKKQTRLKRKKERKKKRKKKETKRKTRNEKKESDIWTAIA